MNELPFLHLDAAQNFSPENARILMDCLRDFDESQARRFTDSLRPNDL